MLLSSSVFAQTFSNKRVKYISVADTVIVDSLSIIPKSLIISNGNKLIDVNYYVVDYAKSEIYFNTQLISKGTKLTCVYKVFSFNFNSPYPKQKPVFLSDTVVNKIYFMPKPYNPYYADDDAITINGSIMRGVSAGNNQNVATQSDLNLQITGKLSSNLQIEAYLSDKNIPIQPDGYNQQIQEFDKIYMRLFNDSTFYLQMGDVSIKADNSYFLHFNRNILGFDVGYKFRSESMHIKNQTQLSGAVAKGNYKRMIFNAKEGVQDPYKLQGNNNEVYIVVLAGSEKIYLDGKLLTRGENADYIIDYNTAELTFTAKNMLTANSRIIAEYEYSNQDYNRFMLYAKNTVTYNKLTFNVQFFNESDAKNQPLNIMLSQQQKQLLRNSGDNSTDTFVSTIDSVGFSQNRVLYQMIDTVVSGVFYDSVLVYSTNADSAFYRASFVNVGNNKGNYIVDNGNVNGKIYKWVSPINGEKQGNYSPVKILLPPQKKQVAVASLNYAITKNSNIYIETVVSDNDKNTFSHLDNADNQGVALKTLAKHKFDMGKYAFSLLGDYELKTKYFNAIDRYKSVEFNRDWNTNDTANTQEQIVGASVIFTMPHKQQINYKAEYLNRQNYYDGLKHTANVFCNDKYIGVKAYSSLLNSVNDTSKSKFYRHNIELYKSVKKFLFSVNNSLEDNRLSYSDSLLTQSKKFNQWQGSIGLSDSLKYSGLLLYKYRTDYLSNKTDFSPLYNTKDLSFLFNISQKQNHQLSATVTWRELEVVNKELSANFKNENNFLANVRYNLRLPKSWLTLFAFYETATGMESKKEYYYVKVPAGQGLYVWIDYNKNNIPELNEFEVSAFANEADYIRIYTPTNDYIKVFTIKLNETLNIKPYKIWHNSKGLKKIVSLFENITSLQITKKHTNADFINRINPFSEKLADSTLINNMFRLNNTLSFNKRNSVFGADWIFNIYKRKMLMANGFNMSESKMQALKLRFNISSDILIINKTSCKQKTFSSEAYQQKNYHITSVENNFVAQWQPTVKLRLSVPYTFKYKIDSDKANDKVRINKILPEVKYSIVKKGTLSSSVGVVFVESDNTIDVNTAYELNEGYVKGQNIQWSINSRYNITQHLQLSISYNGRKPQGQQVIHTGQFNLSAIF